MICNSKLANAHAPAINLSNTVALLLRAVLRSCLVMSELHSFLSPEIISVLEGIRPEDLEELFPTIKLMKTTQYIYIYITTLLYFHLFIIFIIIFIKCIAS